MLLENVVIGHSMESALFAYVNDFYHIQSSNFYPLFFDESRGFSLFGTSNKKQIWTKIKIMLGFLSLNIDYPEVKQIRIQDNTIKVFDDNLLIDFEFERCYIFDTMNISHENKILKAAIGNGSGKAGRVLSDQLEIACSNNQSIKILQIQRQGKNAQKIDEFIRGSSIKKGSLISNA